MKIEREVFKFPDSLLFPEEQRLPRRFDGMFSERNLFSERSLMLDCFRKCLKMNINARGRGEGEGNEGVNGHDFFDDMR